MRLLSAQLTDFRNIRETSLTLSPSFTALIGPNGQGKTNAIESLYLIAALRPLRSVPRRALVHSEASRCEVKIEVLVESTGLTHDLSLALEGASRTLTKDGKKCSAASFLGHAVAVAFTPDDLSLAKGGPDGRRRFLDRALLNIRPAYLDRAMRYTKAVKDRNKVLAERGSDDTLDAFDEIIASEGAAIMAARAEYCAQIGPMVVENFEGICTPAPALTIRYAPSLRLAPDDDDSPESTKAAFLRELAGRRGLDRIRRTTSVGPHLDDVELGLDGKTAKERASQGQHRALVLALKLAEITHLASQLGEPPILLLDDMSSELDRERSRQLFESVASLEGQVILTSTEEPASLRSMLANPDELAIYDVNGGTLVRRP